MATVTLAKLRARARERADMVGSSFVTDTADSLDSWINEGAQKLHDMLVQAYGNDYVESTYSFSTVQGTADYNLPTDFYKLLGVELQWDATRSRPLKPFNRAEKAIYNNAPRGWYAAPRYRLKGGKITLSPIPQDVKTVTLSYAPLLQVNSGASNLLVSDSDTVDFPNGWERYVVLYAAKICMDKEETSSAQVGNMLEKEEQDLKLLIEQRDLGIPHSAVDMDVVDWDLDIFYR